jgi:Pyruvate/2-oxoacid:ferredoxin oxidoreductase delta subunit
VHECPHKAISLTNKGAWINQEKCQGCGICYQNCASEAIMVVPENDTEKE